MTGSETPAALMLPGAREPGGAVARAPGAIGGPGFGSAGIADATNLLDVDTTHERRKEGGGGAMRIHVGAAYPAGRDQP
jgi:hypothetical protein